MGLFKKWLDSQPARPVDPGQEWNPKYPEVARENDQGTTGTFDRQSEEEQISDDWVFAPSTSHILKMRIYFGEKWHVVNKTAETKLVVQFKPDPKTGKGGGEYSYFFPFADKAFAREIWEDLITSPHPYGECLYPKIIKPRRVEYRANWRG